jgi:DNA-binding MarR family transcriptional regulator
LLHRVTEGLREGVERELRALGLEPPHYLVLATVAEQGPRSQLALGGCAAINRTKMVELIDDLERLGLVQRRQDPADRRAYQIHLTEAGAACRRRADACRAAVEAAWLRALTPQEQPLFRDLLARLAANPPVSPSPPSSGGCS